MYLKRPNFQNRPEPLLHSGLHLPSDFYGNVEKSRQRRSRPLAVLTYYESAPRVKRAAALLDGLF